MFRGRTRGTPKKGLTGCLLGVQGALQSAPTPPVGSQYSCQPTVKLLILPLVWIFLWERGSTGAQGAAAENFLGRGSFNLNFDEHFECF